MDHLLADLRRIYEGGAWHGPSVREAISDVTARQAASRPLANAHSIYEITHHIAAWIGEVVSRLQGNPPGMPADGDFPPRAVEVDDAAWADVRTRLERRQAELLETLAGFDAQRLDEVVNPNAARVPSAPATFRALLSGLAQHSAYHAGQIVLLKKGLS